LTNGYPYIPRSFKGVPDHTFDKHVRHRKPMPPPPW
jgi:hypothetical protein